MLTPFILLAGGVLVPFVGWLVGIVLLWASHAWTLRDKLVGTLVIPGGLMLPVYLLAEALRAASVEGCGSPRPTQNDIYFICRTGGLDPESPWMIALLVALFVVPLLTTVYLFRRARLEPPTPAPTP
jgi:hypothetical protein